MRMLLGDESAPSSESSLPGHTLKRARVPNSRSSLVRARVRAHTYKHVCAGVHTLYILLYILLYYYIYIYICLYTPSGALVRSLLFLVFLQSFYS
jgi:hypothetical protein